MTRRRRADEREPPALPLNEVIQGDCIAVLQTLPACSVNVIFADPPYNLQLRNELLRPNQSIVDGVDDAWDDFRDFAAYDAFTRAWLQECRRVLRDDGTIWVIGSYHNIFRVGAMMMDLGYWILNDVIWHKCLAGDTELLALINRRPIVSTLKDLVRINPHTHTIQLPSYDAQGKCVWVDVVGFGQTEKTHGLRIECDDGTWVECTPEHRFPVVRSGAVVFVPAAELQAGESLLQLHTFDLPVAIDSEGMDEALGEFIGWYLAEGDLLQGEDGIRFSLSADEQTQAEHLIAIARLSGYRLRFAYTHVPYQHGQAEIIKGEMRENTNKRWSYVSLDDLGLPSRGHFATTQRHSIASLRKKYQEVTRKNKVKKMSPLSEQVIHGDIQVVKIKQIHPSAPSRFYDISLNTNHVFALANGLLTHNSNPMPNFRGTRFQNATETLIWAKKSADQKRYTFHYHAMKNLNDEKQMQNVWHIPLCTGPERIKIDGKKAHSTQKPEALLYRVLLASSNPGDVVLDPFFGTGTTGAVARRLGRNYIGIERDSAYVEMARARLAPITPAAVDAAELTTPSKRSAPRVSFGQLIAAHYIEIGQRVYSKGREIVATVKADSQLHWGDQVGSIHKIAALAQGKSAFNGWEYWYCEDAAGQLISIDALREQYRARHMTEEPP